MEGLPLKCDPSRHEVGRRGSDQVLVIDSLQIKLYYWRVTKSAREPQRRVSGKPAQCCCLHAGLRTWQTAPTEQGREASLVFSLSLVFLFTVSGLYHVLNWEPQTRKWWRRLDHAAIFVQIAGNAVMQSCRYCANP